MASFVESIYYFLIVCAIRWSENGFTYRRQECTISPFLPVSDIIIIVQSFEKYTKTNPIRTFHTTQMDFSQNSDERVIIGGPLNAGICGKSERHFYVLFFTVITRSHPLSPTFWSLCNRNFEHVGNCTKISFKFLITYEKYLMYPVDISSSPIYNTIIKFFIKTNFLCFRSQARNRHIFRSV